MYGVAIVGQLLLSFVIAVVLKSTGLSGIGGGILAGSRALARPSACRRSRRSSVFGYRNRQFVVVDGVVMVNQCLRDRRHPRPLAMIVYLSRDLSSD